MPDKSDTEFFSNHLFEIEKLKNDRSNFEDWKFSVQTILDLRQHSYVLDDETIPKGMEKAEYDKVN